ncbi:MAG: hypothetical protein ACK4F9_02405 [Brevinematia bacterium]
MDISNLVARGIPEKIANFLVSYFKGDMEKVYFVLNSLRKDVVVLKLKFSFSIYLGVAIIFINTRSKTIDLVKSYVSQSPEISKINIEIPWREVIKSISDNIKVLQVDLDLSKKADYIFSSDSKFSQTLIKLVCDNRQYLDIKRFLYTYIPIVLGDQNAVVRFSFERIDVFSFYRFIKDSNIPIPENLKFIEEEGVLSSVSISDIAVQPVLSPIDGVSMNYLKPGDEIVVKILDTDEVSRCFVKDDGIVPAKILSIKPLENERNLVAVEIGPGFVGNFVIKNDVKLKSTKSTQVVPENQQSMAYTIEKSYDSLEREGEFREDEYRSSEDIEKVIEKERDNSLVFWIVNISIIVLGIAIVAIILLFI